MKGVVIPPYPGVTSALGLLLSDVRHDYVHSDLRDLNDVQANDAEAVLLRLRDQGMAQLRREGYSADLCRFVWDMHLRNRYQLLRPWHLHGQVLGSRSNQFPCLLP